MRTYIIVLEFDLLARVKQLQKEGLSGDAASMEPRYFNWIWICLIRLLQWSTKSSEVSSFIIFSLQWDVCV